jgi:hypothetical protein
MPPDGLKAPTASVSPAGAAPAGATAARQRLLVPQPHDTVARLRAVLQRSGVALRVEFDGPAWLVDAAVPDDRRAQLLPALGELGLTLAPHGQLHLRVLQAP